MTLHQNAKIGVVSPALEIEQAAKIGAGLFIVWGLLHLWVGGEGLHQYFTSPADGQWKMIIGGSNAPESAFVLSTDPVTMHAQANLILNFCLDVAGFGVLGIVVAYLLLSRGSWIAYLIGVFVIGIADVSYTLLFVTSGVIALNVGTVAGPIVWLIAIIVTPFGLPPISKTFGSPR